MRALAVAGRGIFGLALLALLLRRVGWRDLAATLSSPEPVFVIVSLAFSVLLIGVSCLKWRWFLEGSGVEVGFARLFALYLVGMFFNNFLPSNFGGDVVRSVGLGRYTRRMREAFATVFLERLTGFVALVGCAWAGVLLDPSLVERGPVLAALLFASGLLAVVCFWAPRGFPTGPIAKLLPKRFGARVTGALEGFSAALRGVDRALVAKAMALSFAFYGLAVLNVYYSAQVFGRPPDLAGLAVAVPLVLIVSMVPISLGGVGLAEWAYVVGLGQIGLPENEALAVALFLRLKILLLSAIGGILFVALRSEPAAPPNAQEIA